MKKLYERKKDCLDVIGAVFWVVLVVALAIEFLGNAKAMRIADSINSKLVAEAGQARKDASRATEQAAKANSKTASALLKVEQLQSDNIAYEMASFPRKYNRIPESVGHLEKFAGTKFIILSNPKNPFDFESRNLANSVEYVLQLAGWKSWDSASNDDAEVEKYLKDEKPNSVRFWNGIEIQSDVGPGSVEISGPADALVQELNERNIMARRAPFADINEVADTNKLAASRRISTNAVNGDVLVPKPRNFIVVKVGQQPSLSEVKIFQIENDMWGLVGSSNTPPSPAKMKTLQQRFENQMNDE